MVVSVITYVHCPANSTDTELLKLRHTSAAKSFPPLNYFVPDFFIQIIKVAVSYIIFKQSVDQSRIEIISGTDGADCFQRFYRIFFADQIGTK